ncbi:MAG: alpha-amylase family glycosyl hydrolase [Parvularcula sp.]|jgi:alpha-glucosidase|nr:alpha-amylase family glycosyl hydrolase [Parvularcula sp.]
MTPWWKGAVLYQIWPRSFADSDGDGVGDLVGVIERLPYLRDLGVEGVWLSPFFPSPMKDYGYDVADYRGVDPLFGDLPTFERLIAEAHRHGLKVVIDQVYSHSSDQHAWFRESRSSRDGPYADWYVWADPKPDGTPPNNWLSVFGGPAWTWDARRRQYYLHNFLDSQPDLNFHNPDVREAVLEVAKFWLDLGVDGFRLDVANYFVHDQNLRDNPASGTLGHARPGLFQDHLYERSRPENVDFISSFRQLLDQYEGRFAVAEIDSSRPFERSLEYTQGSERLHTAYNFQLLRARQLTPALIAETVSAWNAQDAWPSWSISNHDVHRAVTRWSGVCDERTRALQIAALLLSLRGTVFLYQGDELGLPQAEVAFEDLRDPEAIRFYPADLGRDGARTPIPWNRNAPHGGFTTGEPWMPLDPRHLELAAKQQAEAPDSVLSEVKTLIALRKESDALRSGQFSVETADASLLVIDRQGTDRVCCVFNLGEDEVTVSGEGEVIAGTKATTLRPGEFTWRRV